VTGDRLRVWVKNQVIIDDWTAHTQDTTDSGQIYLQGGTQYSIRVEYYEGTSKATIMAIAGKGRKRNDGNT
jgi:hypothetical protein